MASTLVKKAMLKITADDGDTETKLARISAKADELAAKHPDLKVRIDTGAAAAKLAVLRKELRATADAADPAAAGRFRALRSALNDLTLGLSGGWSEASALKKMLLGLNLATGLAEPLLAGAAVAAGGMASGLAAGGLAAAAFGAVAKANLSVAAQAATAAQAAQSHYTASVAAAGAAYKRAMGTAATAAQRQQAETAKASALQSAYKARVQATTAAYANLTPAQIALSKQVGGMQDRWHQFTASFAPMITQIVGQVRPLISELLPDVGKLVRAGGTGISSLLTGASRSGALSGLKSFLSAMAHDAPAVIGQLGAAIAHIVSGIGGILTAFRPVSSGLLTGVDNLTARFARWGQTLTGHSGFQSLMAMFRAETPMAVGVLKNLAAALKVVVGQMTGMSTFSNSKMLLQLALPVTHLALALLKAHPELVWLVLYLKMGTGAAGKLKTAVGGISDGLKALKAGRQMISDFAAGFGDATRAAGEATGAAGTWGGRISSVFGSIKTLAIQAAAKLGLIKTATVEATAATEAQAAATEGEAAAQEAADVAMDANPIGLIIGAIVALIAVIVLVVTHFKTLQRWAADAFHFVARIASDAIGWIKDHWKLLLVILTGPIGLAIIWVTGHWHQITDVIGEAIDWVKAHWPLLLAILTGPIGLAVLFIVRHWDQITSGAQRMFHDVVSFFTQLPGRIISALAALGQMLFNAGKNAMGGLIRGFESMIGSVGSVVGGIAHKVAGFFGLSPAKEGPLAGRGAPEIRGAHFADELARGMASRSASVSGAARRLAAAAGITGAPAASALAGAGGRRMELTVRAGSSDPFMRELLRALRFEIRTIGGGGPDSVQIALGRTT